MRMARAAVMAGMTLCLVCLSGCGVYDYFFPEKNASTSAPVRRSKRLEQPKSATPSGSVVKQKEAHKMIAEAKALWRESSVCDDPRAALVLLNQALRLEPDNVEAFHYRALAYKDLKYWDGAENDATSAVTHGARAEDYAARSLVFAASGNWLGAEKDARRAMVMDEGLPIALIAMADVDFHNNDAVGACRLLEKACDLGECQPWKRAVEAGKCARRPEQ